MPLSETDAKLLEATVLRDYLYHCAVAKEENYMSQDMSRLRQRFDAVGAAKERKATAQTPRGAVRSRYLNKTLATADAADQGTDAIISVRFHIDHGDVKLRDTLTVNVAEARQHAKALAETICVDMDLTLAEWRPLLVKAIEDAVKDWEGQQGKWVQGCGGPWEAVFKLDIVEEGVRYRDFMKLEVPFADQLVPELVAKSMVRELKLPQVFVSAIAHAIREQASLLLSRIYALVDPIDDVTALLKSMEEEMRECTHSLPLVEQVADVEELEEMEAEEEERERERRERERRDMERDARRRRREQRGADAVVAAAPQRLSTPDVPVTTTVRRTPVPKRKLTVKEKPKRVTMPQPAAPNMPDPSAVSALVASLVLPNDNFYSYPDWAQKGVLSLISRYAPSRFILSRGVLNGQQTVAMLCLTCRDSVQYHAGPGPTLAAFEENHLRTQQHLAMLTQQVRQRGRG